MIKIFYKFLFYDHELSVPMDIDYGIVDLYSDLSPITFPLKIMAHILGQCPFLQQIIQ